MRPQRPPGEAPRLPGKDARRDAWLLVLSGAFALAGALLMLWITWEHNPQGEFHEEGRIHWGSWLPYAGVGALVGAFCGASAGLVVSGVIAILHIVLERLWRLRGERQASRVDRGGPRN